MRNIIITKNQQGLEFEKDKMEDQEKEKNEPKEKEPQHENVTEQNFELVQKKQVESELLIKNEEIESELVIKNQKLKSELIPVKEEKESENPKELEEVPIKKLLVEEEELLWSSLQQESFPDQTDSGKEILKMRKRKN